MLSALFTFGSMEYMRKLSSSYSESLTTLRDNVSLGSRVGVPDRGIENSNRATLSPFKPTEGTDIVRVTLPILMLLRNRVTVTVCPQESRL